MGLFVYCHLMNRGKSPILVVGGGPAGMMVGLLLARAGIRTIVLEKHKDFLRDFRGDTVHPATLELFHQLGWLDELLQLKHSRIDQASVRMAGRDMRIADFRHLPVAAPYIVMMPQWDLLNFLAEKGRAYPSFELRMESEAIGADFDEKGRVCGVELADGTHLDAHLVIAADGRRSILRQSAKLPLQNFPVPMDVLWFRLDRLESEVSEGSFGRLEAGQFLIMIERVGYYQCAYAIAKGTDDAFRERGLAAFRADLERLLPDFSASIERLDNWDQVKLLDVTLDRLTCWHRPGLLAIGDAAHAMSPVGGVGINLAVQDAVAAANILYRPLREGADIDPILPQVQRRRYSAIARMQAVQQQAHKRVIAPVLARNKPIERPFLPVRILDRVPILRRIPGRIIGFGFGRENIECPDAFTDNIQS